MKGPWLAAIVAPMLGALMVAAVTYSAIVNVPRGLILGAPG